MVFEVVTHSGAQSRIAHVISTPEGVGGAEKVMLALLRGGAERAPDSVIQTSNGWEGQPLEPISRDDDRCVFVA